MDVLQDPESTKVIIGKQEYYVPPISWYALKRIWPFLSSKEGNPDKTFEDMIDTAIVIISTAFLLSKPEFTPEEISKKLLFNEAQDLLPIVAELLEKSGFRNLGEAMAASPSTGTLNGSSPNAPPEEFAAATGTELNAQ